ncbi:MAG: 30S ribosomal protein S7 [Candidatus Micrarchaeales archaeon]
MAEAQQTTTIQQITTEPKAVEVAAPEVKKVPRKRTPKPPSAVSDGVAVPAPKGSILLFNKYSYDVEILDPSLRNYVNLKPLVYPDSFRKTSQQKFSKAKINIVERLANDIMRGGTGGKISGKVIRTKGRLQGKKFTVMRIIEDAFEIIQKQTGKNPIQIFVRALEYSAPIEDTTRVRYGGIISNIPVDVSASRRLDIALRNLAMATIIGSFGNRKSITETLASELILAARGDVNSYAIKRKNEIERMARSAK